MNASSDPSTFPARGRLLGLDFGTRRIGIAVSTPDQTIASPLENYTRCTPQLDAKYIQTLVTEYRIRGLVVGLPVHMSGDEGEKAKQARAFGEWLSEATNLPVRFWDERYTSAMAEEFLLQAELSRKKRKARLDKLAAQIMLQSYLDSTHRDQAPGQL